MPTLPFISCKLTPLKASLTNPIPLKFSIFLLKIAIPAASCPLCCKAIKAMYIFSATLLREATATTPQHSFIFSSYTCGVAWSAQNRKKRSISSLHYKSASRISCRQCEFSLLLLLMVFPYSFYHGNIYTILSPLTITLSNSLVFSPLTISSAFLNIKLR